MNMQDKLNSSAQGVWFHRRDSTVIFLMVTEHCLAYVILKISDLLKT